MSLEQLAPISHLPTIAPPDPNATDLWCFFYEDVMADESRRRAYEALLTADERERQQRFYFEKDRRLFLATRALVRTVLSKYAPDVAPADWRFAKNEYGKPRIAERETSLSFNLSNTRGLVVCAVSTSCDVLGVDAENLQRDSETISIADRFFSPKEVRALRAQPATRQRERFFSYWTLKESYIKARGMGLAIPLAHFSFELDEGDDIAISFSPELDDDPVRWQFALLRASEHHFIAVGIAAPRLELRVATIVP